MLHILDIKSDGSLVCRVCRDCGKPYTEGDNTCKGNLNKSVSKIDKVLILLEGIDKTQSEDNTGWWETSVGAEFGAEILSQLLCILEENN